MDASQQQLARAYAEHRAGNLAEARRVYKLVLAKNPRHFDALNLLAEVHCLTGKFQDAELLLRRAISVNPNNPHTHFSHAYACHELGRLDAAVASYDKSIALRSDDAEAWFNRGNVLRDAGRHQDALASYGMALSLRPDLADAHVNSGQALLALRRPADALAHFDRALTLKPDFAEAHNNRGTALLAMQKSPEALAEFDRALALKPDSAEVHNNRGTALLELRHYDEGLAAVDTALSLKPDLVEALTSRGEAMAVMKRPVEAMACYAKILSLNPDRDLVLGSYLHAKMRLCDWDRLDEYLGRYAAGIAARRKVTLPFIALGLLDAPELHRIAAQVHADTEFPPNPSLGPFGLRPSGGKIRVGYYSADFRRHATSALIAEVFEGHDRDRFELFGFYFGPDERDAERNRVELAFDKFFDVGNADDISVAALSRELGIDIAVDLNGYTLHARTGIFAARCAPVQVSYLGYPGTMATGFHDYIVADRTVISAETAANFSEKIVYLPHSYQSNDSRRPISDRVYSREELGLPPAGFVYCCFNASYKILPETFAGWMRVLKAVGSSVLWLLEDNAVATANLRRSAEAHGVDAERLVFASHVPMDEHLARHRGADLFLDTLPYNAHTTASDALWAGLPVLTRLGRAFAGRVAASLLYTVGLPELVTDSQKEFEAKAIELANNRDVLAGLKQRLDANRSSSPLFDGVRFARGIEAAYEQMHARHLMGLPPGDIEVPATSCHEA